MTSARHPFSWHLLTGEFPPQAGGVSDHTRHLALALATAGEEVHVWAPRTESPQPSGPVTVHYVPNFGPRGLFSLSAGLAALAGPKRLLVQYVAPAFGYRGLNIPFALWLTARDEEMWVQFHEVAYGFAWKQSPRRNALAAIEWWMAQLVAERAQRVFVSIPGWRHQLGRHGDRAEVLPIPTNLPAVVREEDVDRIRKSLGYQPLVGHFGTYGTLVSELLAPAVVSILKSAHRTRFVLIGRGGVDFAAGLASVHPELATRLVAPGTVDSATAASYIAACDLLIQPYPDGISGRRTSAMAALALGKAVVTTTGHLTEQQWASSGAVVLVSVGDVETTTRAANELLSSSGARTILGERARAWYRKYFSMRHTLAILLRSDGLEIDQSMLL